MDIKVTTNFRCVYNLTLINKPTNIHSDYNSPPNFSVYGTICKKKHSTINSTFRISKRVGLHNDKPLRVRIWWEVILFVHFQMQILLSPSQTFSYVQHSWSSTGMIFLLWFKLHHPSNWKLFTVSKTIPFLKRNGPNLYFCKSTLRWTNDLSILPV